jgi:MFS family permease
MLAATLLWGTIEAYLPLFATESLAMPVAFVGYVFACQALVNGMSRLFGGWIADWRSDLRWLITLCGTCGYALAIAVGVNLPGWLPIPCLIAGVALISTSFVSLGARFGEISTGSTRGLTMGFYSLTVYLGLAAGPVLFGPLMQRAGFVTGFVVCALVASCLACAAELLGRRFP